MTGAQHWCVYCNEKFPQGAESDFMHQKNSESIVCPECEKINFIALDERKLRTYDRFSLLLGLACFAPSLFLTVFFLYWAFTSQGGGVFYTGGIFVLFIVGLWTFKHTRKSYLWKHGAMSKTTFIE